MNIALWVIQALLAAMFLYAGGMKVFAYEKYLKMAAKHPTKPGLSRGMVTFIGASELAGALGLILPLASGVAPFLTWIAAVGLGVIMILGAAYHIQRKESPALTLILLVLCAAVAIGRSLY